jgi:hypothetical protein
MFLKFLILIVSIGALALLAAPRPSAAQIAQSAQSNEPAIPAPRRVRRRIEINPRPLLYRRCVDWYELQHRPSGTVLYPAQHCWWVRG